jgi:Raf kinase inhibitor-like YbhB/YbcL family protein
MSISINYVRLLIFPSIDRQLKASTASRSLPDDFSFIHRMNKALAHHLVRENRSSHGNLRHSARRTGEPARQSGLACSMLRFQRVMYTGRSFNRKDAEMDRLTNRRAIIATAAIAAGGVAMRGSGVALTFAQATPSMPGTPQVVEGRNPYEFLADLPTFTLTSTDVQDGMEMPVPQRSGMAGGEDISPQLSWSGQPEGVQSYVVTMYDPDAPTPSGFWHWAVFNIPGDTTELPSGAGTTESTLLPEGSTQLANDVGSRQYIGAAPPPGPPHRYFIVVLALDIPSLEIPPESTPALMSFNTLGHILGYGMLVPIATP